MITNLEFLSEITNILRDAPASHGILGIYLFNGTPQVHMTEGAFLQLFPTYKEEKWDAGTFSTKLVATINGAEVFCLTNIIQIEGELKECKCDMRTKLVGDGCSVCNPDYWKDMMKEDH